LKPRSGLSIEKQEKTLKPSSKGFIARSRVEGIQENSGQIQKGKPPSYNAEVREGFWAKQKVPKQSSVRVKGAKAELVSDKTSEEPELSHSTGVVSF
jgi:hypothetical protein